MQTLNAKSKVQTLKIPMTTQISVSKFPRQTECSKKVGNFAGKESLTSTLLTLTANKHESIAVQWFIVFKMSMGYHYLGIVNNVITNGSQKFEDVHCLN